MLDNYLEEYIKDLMINQNEGALKEQKNLFSEKDYYELLKPVVELVKEYKSDSPEELRDRLYQASGLAKKVEDFVYTREMTPGMVFSYGTPVFRETVVVGNKQEVSLDNEGHLVPKIEKMTEDTIFDLASITKVFTSLSTLRLVKENKIKLRDEVKKYVPEFEKLDGITIFDLLSFKYPLRTDGRIEEGKDREEADKIFKGMYVDQSKIGGKGNPYNDLDAMVLKCVIEKVTGESFYDYVDKTILTPLGMVDSFAAVPKYKLDRVASTSFETKYFKEKGIVDLPIRDNGIVNDGKAYIMGQPEGVLSGHAGMFSTVKDVTTLAKAIIGGQVIDEEYLEMMAKNRTGRMYLDDNNKEKYIQYLGFLCYSKNPILADSEVFHAMSGKTFANGGFTGNQLTVDPINELYFFLAANRTHNRVSIVEPAVRGNVHYENDGLGRGTLVLPDGRVKVVSYKYAWDRDAAVVHPCLQLAIQYKFLEDICKLYNYGQVDQVEKVRQL